jgi:hypothetical protein
MIFVSSTGGMTKFSIEDLPPGTPVALPASQGQYNDFASGKVDAEAFKGKVTTTTYSGSGIGITSINSWIQEGSSRFRGQ